jgi:hypothetical protein
MIISHQHRYVFVQTPMTGCTSIGKELAKHYAGEKILCKHSTYTQFCRQASAKEKRYFVFGGIRNPFDRIVSLFHKLLYDHEDYLNKDNQKRLGPRTTRYQLKRFRYIRDTGADFSDYFLHFYHRFDPKLPPPQLPKEKADHLLRFERLASDFRSVLERLDLEPVRDLPLVNKTPGRMSEFETYYDERCRRLAISVLGPWAYYWGYQVPLHWRMSVPTTAKNIFAFKMVARRLFAG